MKRFWKDVTVRQSEGCWQLALDERVLKTQGGHALLLPTQALAEALAQEWRDQGEVVDPHGFVLRDLADYAIDCVGQDRDASIARLLPYAQTDTLCYRADPGSAHLARQEELWEPLLQACEARLDCRFERVSGIIHSAQPAATMTALETELKRYSQWELASLETTVPMAASLVTGLAALDAGADADALFAAANAEEDWQAELWGKDAEAEAARAARLGAFRQAVRFASLAQR
ncbi:ATP12 family protein [Paraurantiacibacter namhicola]|uniref:ATP12 chaperone protein n=1 Tax=Paraurantiacibacter namhicola TaxID=645517 RepID=A0A1C7DB00_9SPHN|nr:ATP12 family protein [Paraurantiacibacter namhicola]ANU08628.1 ATP12 chaperone protein [Paraurantiacibacter namhicola]